MVNCSDVLELELICLIVNHGSGSKVSKIAKQNGISGATVLLGKGTIKNRILELLDLTDIRKEIIIMISERKSAYQALEELDRELHLHKPNHGIAFTVSVESLIGVRNCKYDNVKESRGVENTMYKAIFVVVDKGSAEAVVEAATSAGSRGATIINARGSGIHETNMLFAMAIEPEKEMVMILSDNSVTDSIITSIREQMKIEEPGKGIMFVLDVNKTYGLYQNHE
ncbi:MAG: transcriptional regulator [Clostridia bacterium BRH_c25]|nr:MAG: transcriptional regulator [Clostridia bacterium BRH_c25]